MEELLCLRQVRDTVTMHGDDETSMDFPAFERASAFDL